MPPTTRCEFGDVVLVPFPFTDQTGVKRRPAVVVSATRLNALRPDVVILAITTQATAGPGELAVSDWQAAGLVRPSTCKPVFATIAQALILRKLGRLAPSDATAIRSHLRNLLG